MTTRIRTITIDCRDPFAMAKFWAEALGFVEDPANPNAPDDPEALLIDPKGLHPELLFQPVPEGKVAKNRLHLDLMPDVLRDVEVERMLSIGATLLDDLRNPDGSGWAVLADPEGNEFCVLRSAAERISHPVDTDGAERDDPAPIDTGERAFPAVRGTGERELLEGMLEWYRVGVITKVEGVAQHHAVAQPLGSPTSIAGLVKHLALVEESWFVDRFAGEPVSDWWADVDWDADPDWEFNTAGDEPIALQLDRYRVACERSRHVAAAHQLDDLAANDQRGPTNLRFLITHLLEETARHLGHLDVLRELLDGSTGE